MIVEFEVRGRVGLIRLNRPDARNAVNSELAEAVETAIDRLEDDDRPLGGNPLRQPVPFSRPGRT